MVDEDCKQSCMTRPQGGKESCKVEVQSLSPREMKPKLIGSPVSKKYRLVLLENETDYSWSLSWENHTLRT